MCTGCFPEDIIVCPVCKRDDEAYKLGEAEPIFTDIGGGKIRCICGHIFSPEQKIPHETSA